ncbi:MAG: S-layer homology domain-containing protein [Firmicutes bacterium]|nr:S-layer homology domain-containing protein [Bacillota bacterium]MBQ6296063.1 S-layer homology domain-containing protein [Bacillota bacterium]MBR0210608.1 S-layer homology domain-containing protein [Bacillota bacterium]
MAKRLTTMLLVLALCLALMPAQSFAVSAPKKAVVKDLGLTGKYVTNYDGYGMVQTGTGKYLLIDTSGKVLHEASSRMEYDAVSDLFLLDGIKDDPGYYRLSDDTLVLSRAALQENVRAFLQENYPMGELVQLETRNLKPFTDGYAANQYRAVYSDAGETRSYEFFVLINASGLVVYCTPLIAFTSGGGYPLRYFLGYCGEGLVTFKSEFQDPSGVMAVYEAGYKDLGGEDVMVFAVSSPREYQDDPGVTLLEAAKFADCSPFESGMASASYNDGTSRLLDHNGKMSAALPYNRIGTFLGNYAPVYTPDAVGYIDTAGNLLIPMEYMDAAGGNGEIFTVCKDGLWGIVDADNKAIVPFEYSAMSSPALGAVYAVKDGKVYAITFEDVKEDDTLTPWGTKKVSAVFKDVPEGAWYERYLQAAYENGIVGGKGNGIYDPQDNLKHGEIMVMVTRLHEMATGEKFQPAPNPTDHWARAYCDYCKAEGIIDGRFDNKLEDKVTRAEMAYYFANALEDRYYGDDADVSLSDIATEEYGAEILKLAKSDVVTGYDVEGQTAKEFRPAKLVTRAEAAVFVTNILGLIGPTGGVY